MLVGFREGVGGVREIETDYLIVGAGASGMAFVDSLIAESDAEVVIVDRRHRPGGHWLDAYPFVRLHQPSAYYGVNSRRLGHDRIDESGINAGFYERATAAEICDYFNRVLEDHVASGRVRFMAMSDYRDEDGDGHHVVSLLTGEETTVRVRRRFVDATYTESSIPSRHTPSFVVDEGVRLVPPNDLVDLQDAPSGFTIIGAGKTAMDTCNWLLDEGVDPGRIRWIRPRDGWLFNRAFFQPLAEVGSYMQLQARWVEAAANADDRQRVRPSHGGQRRPGPDRPRPRARGLPGPDDQHRRARRAPADRRRRSARARAARRPRQGHTRRRHDRHRPRPGLRGLHRRGRAADATAPDLRARPHHRCST